jgi:pimeloyl-ACP methyl ester carboxylesterase
VNFSKAANSIYCRTLIGRGGADTVASVRMRVLAWSVLVFVLGLGAVSALIEHVLEVRDAARLTANESFYSVDGRRIRYRRIGPLAPGPTVVLLTGGAASLEQWDAVQTSLSAVVPVFSYDRTGFGFSDPATAYDANASADELDRFLHSPGISGPFVLVSYSSSSYIAIVFAARHPDVVQGMVFVDPNLRSPTPGTKPYRRIYWRQLVVTPLEAFFGYSRLKSAILSHNSPPASPLADRSNAVIVSAHHWLAIAHDVMSLDESADEADAAMASRPLTHFPVGVLTTVDPAEGGYSRGLFERQQKLATDSERGIVRVVHVEHSELLNDPGAIGAIVDLIRTIVDAVHKTAVDAAHNTGAAGTDIEKP